MVSSGDLQHRYQFNFYLYDSQPQNQPIWSGTKQPKATSFALPQKQDIESSKETHPWGKLTCFLLPF